MSTLTDEMKVRFLLNECTEEELRAVNDWMRESKEHARQLFELEELYQLGKLDDTSDEQKAGKAEKRLFRRLEEERKHQHRRLVARRWMKMAAMLAIVLLMGGGGYFFYTHWETEEPLLAVTTGEEIEEMVLADGTKVWLNKHSTLRYPQEFSEDRRQVYLEGEGYFEVKRNPDKPFVVWSDAMQVRVLGTVFNLKSDEGSRSAVATLLKGEIEVEGNHDEGRVILAPGQRAELNGLSGRLVVKQGDTGFESWHSRQFIFDKADIFTIARTLEQSYGVKVILSPDINIQKTYTGALPRKESVKEVLNQLGNVIPVKYKIVGNSVFLSSKKK